LFALQNWAHRKEVQPGAFGLIFWAKFTGELIFSPKQDDEIA